MSDKPRVLFVDDDERLLKAAKRILRKYVDLQIATGGPAALEILEKSEPFSVIVSDQNMPDMKGASLLSEVRKRWPLTVRIMLTGNNDLATAVSAINSGHIFRFLNKPCDTQDLLEAIQEGHSQYNLMTVEKELLEQTLTGSLKVLVDVLALTNPAAFERASEVRRLSKEFAKRKKIDRPWELDVASMLWPLGFISLPIDLLAKMTTNEILSSSEQELLLNSPTSSRDLLCNIPRMENIAETIYYSGKGFDGSGFPNDKVSGDQIPEHARILHILIDFVKTKANGKISDLEAFKSIKQMSHRYDPNLLAIAGKIFSDHALSNSAEQQAEMETKTPLDLTEGDVIIDDIIDNQNRLLLSAGNMITKLMIQRLRNMHKLGLVHNSIRVKKAHKIKKRAHL